MRHFNIMFLSLGLAVIVACSTAGNVIVSPKLSTTKHGKIAVMLEQRTPSKYVEAGDVFLSAVESEFIKLGFDVLDRENIKKVMAEAELNQAIDNPSEMGRLLGVRALVFLKYQGTGRTVMTAQMRMVDVETSGVLITASYSARGKGQGGSGFMGQVGELENAARRKSASDVAEMFFKDIKAQIK